jgi:hypothetical protein
MKNKEKKISKLIKNKQFVKIERNKVSKISDDGFIILNHTRLLLFQQIYDFHIMGYSIIRKKDITKLRSNKADKFYTKMMKLEGIIDKIRINFEINLEDWKSALNSLMNNDKFIIIESEKLGNDYFYIGRIERVDDGSVVFLTFNPEGKWDSKFDIIPFKEITKIQFDEKYIDIFRKYVRD